MEIGQCDLQLSNNTTESFMNSQDSGNNVNNSNSSECDNEESGVPPFPEDEALYTSIEQEPEAVIGDALVVDTAVEDEDLSSPDVLIQRILQSDVSISIGVLCCFIARLWEENSSFQENPRFPQELKKYDISYLTTQVSFLDLTRCMAIIHLEILLGPIPSDLKMSLRGSYWFLQQVHESVKSQWNPSDADPNWFAHVAAPLMQQAHHGDVNFMSKEETDALIRQLSQALTIAYSEFLTHRISVIANDDAIFSANWSFNHSTSSAIHPPLDKLPVDVFSDVLEVARRLLRAIDPLLKSLEVLGAVVGVLVATRAEQDAKKASLLYDVLPLELNSLLTVATHLVAVVAAHQTISISDEKWMQLGKPFRSIRHRIDGIKHRFSRVCSSNSESQSARAILDKVIGLAGPSDLLLSSFSGYGRQYQPYPTLCAELPLPLPAKESFESYVQQIQAPTKLHAVAIVKRCQQSLRNQKDLGSSMVAALDSELASFSHSSSRRKDEIQTSHDIPIKRRSRHPISTSLNTDSAVSEPSKDSNEDSKVFNKEVPSKSCVPIDVGVEESGVKWVGETFTRMPKPGEQSESGCPSYINQLSKASGNGAMEPPHPVQPSPCPPTAVYPFYLHPDPNTSNSALSYDSSRLASWEVDHSEVQLEQRVGSGATAAVFRGMWRGTEVAVKKMSGQLADPDSLAKFQREIQILLKLRHPNLALLMGASVRRRPYFVVMEYCVGGDLFTLLHVPEKSVHHVKQLTVAQKVKIATDIAKGMTYLHKMTPQIIHRDLKSLNILLANVVRSKTDEPLAKITDFGLSQLRSGRPSELLCQTAAVGTYHWMAPEVLTSQPYNEKVDVYSFGILLYEIFLQAIPYSSPPPSSNDLARQHPAISNPVNVALAVAQGHRPNITRIPRDCPASIVTLMVSCWSHDPVQRPSFETVLETLKRVAQSVNQH